jgi:hypothetical protein
MRDDILEENENYRVRILPDQDPMEPEVMVPMLRFDRGGAEHIDNRDRPTDNDSDIENAAVNWGSPGSSDFFKFEKYLRAFFGTTAIESYYSGSYWYVAYDTAAWREHTGVTDGPAAVNAWLNEWKSYVEGEVYFYVVEEKASETTTTTFRGGRTETNTTEVWETVDSCGGFIGWDYAVREAREAFEREAGE